jgi:rRNA maturation protein Nop10
MTRRGGGFAGSITCTAACGDCGVTSTCTAPARWVQLSPTMMYRRKLNSKANLKPN